VVASHAGRFASGAHFRNRHLNTALCQIDRECQADGTTADDQHLRVDSITPAAW
jgi:hypothetical protein